MGKAVQFNGKDTGLFFPGRPLVGAKTFTIEAIFRPEGGDFQQRWMHIAETDPKTGSGRQSGRHRRSQSPLHVRSAGGEVTSGIWTLSSTARPAARP